MSRCNDENDIPNLIFIFALLTINEKKVFSLYHLKNETMRINLCLLLFLVLLNISCNSKRAGKKEDVEKDTYANPLFMEGANSSAIYHNGKYYYTHETNEQIYLWVTTDITDMAHSTCKEVWVPKDPSNSHNLWNPEIRNINGKWYIYFAGGDKDDVWAIRPYVLECADTDPLTGVWTEKGKMGRADADEFSFEAFSLDATVFENKGKHYYVWAEKVGVGKQISNLYIGEMETPYKLKTVQVLLTSPDYDWERVGFWVNEGPAVIHHDGRIYLTYSASETGAAYCMGMLTADEDSDLLDPKSWTKERYPVLRTDESRGIYGPGHNSFTEDEEGNPVMVYHARTEAEIEGNPLYNPNRHAMLMKIRWDEKTGAPIFSYED